MKNGPHGQQEMENNKWAADSLMMALMSLLSCWDLQFPVLPNSDDLVQ